MDYNVAGALNARFQFYRGLAEGGAIRMTDEEILKEVWSDEDSVRKDAEEWLMGYLLLAYRPLSDVQLQSYVDLSRTPAGQAFNRGLFAGFEGMYRDLSRALGVALALEGAADTL